MFPRELESAPPLEIIRWTLARHAPRVALACSFGGPSGLMLLDLTMQVDPTVPVLYLDTGLLFAETHELITQISERYRIRPQAVRPELSLEAQAAEHGRELWAREPDRCCSLRKVIPWKQALAGYAAWMTAIRRDQGVTRAATSVVAWDARFDLLKVSPLAHVREDDVWAYLQEHDIPYNALHDRGYPSIGCRPCTRAVQPGEAPRAGRWSSFVKTECGLHSRGGH